MRVATATDCRSRAQVQKNAWRVRRSIVSHSHSLAVSPSTLTVRERLDRTSHPW